jgi:hypothetical protein
LLNSVYGQPTHLKLAALEAGMMRIVPRVALASREPRVVGMCYAAMCSLAENCERACAELAADAALVQQLVRATSGPTHSMREAEAELLERASELFLVLFDCAAATGALLRCGGLRCLEQMAASSPSQLHAARARQALQEHRGGFT